MKKISSFKPPPTTSTLHFTSALYTQGPRGGGERRSGPSHVTKRVLVWLGGGVATPAVLLRNCSGTSRGFIVQIIHTRCVAGTKYPTLPPNPPKTYIGGKKDFCTRFRSTGSDTTQATDPFPIWIKSRYRANRDILLSHLFSQIDLEMPPIFPARVCPFLIPHQILPCSVTPPPRSTFCTPPVPPAIPKVLRIDLNE